MKRSIIFLMVNMAVAGFTSCHSPESDKNGKADTAIKTSTDTVIIPGSPGPTGSAPRPGDTTQAHNDSLKMASHIADSSR